MFAGKLTAPGYIALPVCSHDKAHDNYMDHGDNPENALPGWPCSGLKSPDFCQVSSFEDQTSDGSPPTDDCLAIVNNVRGTQGIWTIQTAGKEQHRIAKAGKCRFGVQARNLKGNIQFAVGAQDLVDIITDAARMYGGGGRLGAKGKVDCGGNVNDQDIEWGIY